MRRELILPRKRHFFPQTVPGGGRLRNYQIARSLRFNPPDTAYLARTPGVAGSKQKYTVSCWHKRTELGAGSYAFFDAYSSAGNFLYMAFEGDAIRVQEQTASANDIVVITTPLYRDPTAWLHVVVAVDTTQATAANRVRIYANGTEVTSFSTATYPTLNLNTWVNTTNPHDIGRRGDGNLYSGGYMAEIVFVDGQQLTPSSFGVTDATTGVWNPKTISGLTYGTNGFYLKFADNSNTTAATLGKDSSGNANNWTPNNFSIAAGVGNDSLTDTPTSYGSGSAGGDTRGNFCTWNPIWPSASGISNGSLDTTGTAVGTQNAIVFNSYWEISATGAGVSAGVIANPGLTTNTTTIASGKTYGFRLTTAGALDYINITDAGAWTSITTGLTGTQHPYVTGGNASANFGQRAFAASVPATYASLCAQNLPTPLIVKSATAYQTNLRPGTSATATISGMLFGPDFVWLKNRGAASNYILHDTQRGAGAGKSIYSNSTGAEGSLEPGNLLSSFNSDGYTLTADLAGDYNLTGYNFVDWCWRKGAAYGLDIVLDTGTGANKAVAHALGVIPSFIIRKGRSGTTSWVAYHSAVGNGSYLVLNSTAAAAADATAWNSTTPTASVFSVGTLAENNTNSATYVTYLFTPIAGYSAFGSYKGNGSTDGPYINCGFRPAFVLIKDTSAISQWSILDASRDTYNPAHDELYANLTNAEDTGNNRLDFDASGFKVRTTDSGFNTSADTYIYAAFAAYPFKYARAA